QPPRKDDTENATSRGDQCSLDKYLARELYRPCPQRGTDGELLAAGGAARQQQSGEVRAAGQDQEPHSAGEQPERTPNGAHELLDEGIHARWRRLHRVGVLRLEALLRGLQLGLHRIPRGTGAKPSERANEVV